MPADVRAIWQDDAARSPFTSPAFLEVMAAHAAAAGETPVVAIGRTEQGAPHAAWALRTDGSRVLHLLPHTYSDQRTCLARVTTNVGDLAAGLVSAVQSVTPAPAAVVLANVPPWGPTLDAAREAFRQLKRPFRAFPAWPCPVLRVPPGGEAFRAQIDRHRRVRDYAKKLAREPGYAFEVLEDNADLAAWCAEFCDTHQARWAGTPTPSPYQVTAARALFQQVALAWSQDGVLVRFAIRVATNRVAFVVGLRAGTRLIYHHVAVSPTAESLRAGHVLIRLIGLWMSERGFDTLDFGAGGEAYKARYANADEPLWRLYAARSRLSRWYVRGLVEERIRRSPLLQRVWDRWVNEGLRRLLPS